MFRFLSQYIVSCLVDYNNVLKYLHASIRTPEWKHDYKTFLHDPLLQAQFPELMSHVLSEALNSVPSPLMFAYHTSLESIYTATAASPTCSEEVPSTPDVSTNDADSNAGYRFSPTNRADAKISPALALHFEPKTRSNDDDLVECTPRSMTMSEVYRNTALRVQHRIVVSKTDLPTETLWKEELAISSAPEYRPFADYRPSYFKEETGRDE